MLNKVWGFCLCLISRNIEWFGFSWATNSEILISEIRKSTFLKEEILLLLFVNEVETNRKHWGKDRRIKHLRPAGRNDHLGLKHVMWLMSEHQTINRFHHFNSSYSSLKLRNDQQKKKYILFCKQTSTSSSHQSSYRKQRRRRRRSRK